MEFKHRDIPSRKLIQENGIFLRKDDLYNIFGNEYLHDVNSFYIVEKDGTYRDDEKYLYGTAPLKMKELEQAFQKGLTLLVKNLENWNNSIQRKCAELGNSTNVHLYLSPVQGSGFDWHTDDRDVFIYLQEGEKTFEVKDPDGSLKEYLLKPGEGLYIPYGLYHRARTQKSYSWHLSFGVWPVDMTIQGQYGKIEFEIDLI